ncbi:MAG: hypothetical protein M1833_004488 [Piccolia ochrophora]|nr:MAG: hypothetical protein M1833_004488 [Piccolia ochrophora]
MQTERRSLDYHVAKSIEDAGSDEDSVADEEMFDAEEGSSASGSDQEASEEDAEDESAKDADEEDEEEDEEGDAEGDETQADEEGEPVGAVKIPERGDESTSEESEEEIEDTGAVDDRSESEAGTAKASSSADSEVEGQWEEGSEGADEEEIAVQNRNRCIFCGEDEDHDPSEEYEEYMACAVCGDNSHRQCARTNDSLKPEQDVDTWRCPGCVENALEPETTAHPNTSRRRSSAPKITRDLFPPQRGASRPDSHSVFNQLIVNDDPLDGSRLLRKRKASVDEEEEESRPVSRKRQRKKSASESESESTPSSAEEEEESEADADEDAEVEIGPDVDVPTRSSGRRTRKTEKLVATLDKSQDSLLLTVRVGPSRLSRIIEAQPKRRTRRPPKPLVVDIQPRQKATVYHTPAPLHYTTPFYSFHERENDDLKSKPYGGILSEADADTSLTMPLSPDRERFDRAKQQAEEEWKRKADSAESESRASQKVAGPASKIQCISFGGYEIDTWYAAPYPEEYSRNRVLYICEFCLKYMNSDYVAWRHKLKCPAKHPPGDEIYRQGSVSVFEVDGRKNPVYCQNLCLLAKLFLGSKTLYYDVEPFLFYVMTEYDELGCHFVGYFSKEKRPSSSNNVSCILTLPIHQRKGYGNLLIDFSYLLTRVEQKTGSPEKPLSDMGLVSYRNYWRLILCYELRKLNPGSALSIFNISERTGMTADDIVSALEGLRAMVRDPVTGNYALRLDYAYFDDYVAKWEAKAYVRLDEDCLVWTPYVMGRSNLAHFEHAPPLATIAPREGEDDEAEEVSTAAVTGKPVELLDPPPDTDTPTLHNGTTTTTTTTSNRTPSPIPPPGPPPTTPLSKRSPLSHNRKHKSPSTPGSLKQQDHSHHLSPNGLNHKQSSPSPIPTPTTIPPTRYEIYPPLPSTLTASARRRAGRPVGSTSAARRTGGGASSAARSRRRRRAAAAASYGGGASTAAAAMGAGSPVAGAASRRKTRSKMVEMEVVGGDGGVDVEGGNVEGEAVGDFGDDDH